MSAPHRFSLITLGTLAGPTPRAHRAQSSNLLTVDGSYYIVDAGDGVARRLAKAGTAIRDVGTIFITHHHDDHTAGLGTLMFAAWNQKRNRPIHVYGPPGTKRLVEAVVQYFSLSCEIRIADGGHRIPIAQLFFGHDMADGEIFRDENIRVSAVTNSHFDFHKVDTGSGRPLSFSYRFDGPGRAIAFTGDTGPSQAVYELVRGVHLLVSEANSIDDRRRAMVQDGRWQAMTDSERAGFIEQGTRGHLTPGVVGELAHQAGVEAVVLTHLTYRPPPHTDDYGPWVDEVRKHYSGPVFVAMDLMAF